MDASFLRPTGQQFNEALSNAKRSRDITDWMGINDFTIFNPYIHYYPKGTKPVIIDYRIDYTAPLAGSGMP